MKYFDTSLKKISVMTIALSILSIGVLLTSFILESTRVNSFALRIQQKVSFLIAEVPRTVHAWDYRIEYERNILSNNSSKLSPFVAIGNVVSNPSIETPQATTTAQAIPVLLYHGILPVSDSEDVISIDTFKAQMFALKEAGWHSITIEEFMNAMQGKITLPSKSFLLTFDDGRKDSYYNADPIFQALGYNAVMYIVTGHSLAPGNEKSRYYLSENELKLILNTGRWEFQSHSDTGHGLYPINAIGKLGDFFGNNLWNLSLDRQETDNEYQDRIKTDLINSKQKLENNLGVVITSSPVFSLIFFSK